MAGTEWTLEDSDLWLVVADGWLYFFPPAKVEGRSCIELSKAAESEITTQLEGRSYIHSEISGESRL